MTSTTMRVRATASLLVTLAVAVSACTDAGIPQDAAQPVTRPACEVALPAAWQQAFAGSGVATGGSTRPTAVGPAGEVAAIRDNGETRDLLLIGPDLTVTPVYTVPNATHGDRDFVTISAVTMSERWIVVGVSSGPLDENGGRPMIEDGKPVFINGWAPSLARIDVIDRRDNSLRTIVEAAEPNPRSGDEPLDSIALFADTVFWIVPEVSRNGGDVLKSYDLGTGATTEVESGIIAKVRATPVGVAWSRGRTAGVRNLAPLPAGVAAVPDVDEDQSTLVSDGTRYAWLTGLADGGTGIAWWSPATGAVIIATREPFTGAVFGPPPLSVDGPYVMFEHPDRDGSAIVDTRSGAIVDLTESVVGAGGGTIAAQWTSPGDVFAPRIAGLVRTAALTPLSC